MKLEKTDEIFKDLLYGVDQSALALKSVENSEESLNNIEHSLVELNNLLSQTLKWFGKKRYNTVDCTLERIACTFTKIIEATQQLFVMFYEKCNFAIF